jgi:D-alanine-D-alanine ligase
MKKTIGITYDLKDDYLKKGFDPELVAEFDSITTIDAIDEALQEYGYTTVRIGNVYSLIKFLASGKRVDLVFNICEGLFGSSRESQVPSILEAYNIDCTFSSSLVLATSLNKAIAKTIVRSAEIPTADFVVIDSMKKIDDVGLKFPLFVKPLYGGTGIGISSKSLVTNKDNLKKECSKQLEIHKQPILIEKYLDGREFTVGIIGKGDNARAIATMEINIDKSSDNGIYSYKTKSNYLDCVKYNLVEGRIKEECEDVALDAWRSLDCRDGGRVDLKMDKHGVVNFLEVNPLAGLNPIDSDLPILCNLKGISYQQLIDSIMDSVNFRIASRNI